MARKRPGRPKQPPPEDVAAAGNNEKGQDIGNTKENTRPTLGGGGTDRVEDSPSPFKNGRYLRPLQGALDLTTSAGYRRTKQMPYSRASAVAKPSRAVQARLGDFGEETAASVNTSSPSLEKNNIVASQPIDQTAVTPLKKRADTSVDVNHENPHPRSENDSREENAGSRREQIEVMDEPMMRVGGAPSVENKPSAEKSHVDQPAGAVASTDSRKSSLPPHMRIIAEAEEKNRSLAAQAQKQLASPRLNALKPDSSNEHQQVLQQNAGNATMASNGGPSKVPTVDQAHPQTLAQYKHERYLRGLAASTRQHRENAVEPSVKPESADLLDLGGGGLTTPKPYVFDPSTSPAGPPEAAKSLVAQRAGERVGPAQEIRPHESPASVSSGKASNVAFAGNVDESASMLDPVESDVKFGAHDAEDQPRELLNWDGNWAPAPIEWEGRDWFEDSKFEKHMKRWQDNTAIRTPAKADVGHEDFLSGDSVVNEKLELVSAPNFEQPEVPNPEKNPKWGQTSDTSMINMKLAIVSRESRRELKRVREGARAYVESRAPEVFDPYDSEYAPKIRVELRHARRADIQACKGIYLWYCKNTHTVPEAGDAEEAAWEHMRAAFDDVQLTKLPWLVAVQRVGGRGKGEKVVGFAYVEEFGDQQNAYRYTVELQIFVHPDYVRKGVAKTMMDRLLTFLDNHHLAREGYLYHRHNDWEYGGKRLVKKILCNVPYDASKPADAAWVKKWLDLYEFEEVGTLKGVGVKSGKWMNILMLVKTTGRNINLGLPP